MIVFGWRGFPQYAARCVGAFVKTCKEPVVVAAPKPLVPIRGMEEVCGCPVYWVDRVHDFASQVSAFRPSEVTNYIVSGWGIPAFDDLREQVRRAGGRVTMMIDHRYKTDLKTLLENLRFRLVYRRKFDRFFVPGKSGRRLLCSWGVADQLIEEGKNGLSFDPFDVESIALALKFAMAFTDAQLEEMGRVNAQMSNAAGLDKFVEAVSRLTAKT